MQVQYDNERMISIIKIDELDISPPFTVMQFEVISASSLDSHEARLKWILFTELVCTYKERKEVF